MRLRAFGWVQNPSDFDKLKLVVQVFDPRSRHYEHLKNRLVQEVIYFDEDKSRLQSLLDAGINEFSYFNLVGTNKDKNNQSPKTRADAIANALLQISILPQSSTTRGKRYTDTWTADGFLRWAVSFNYVKHIRDKDSFKITPLGLKLVNTELGSAEELEIFRESLLRYPPATRVLSLLEETDRWHTKFYLGSRLGFSGETGFTSYDEDLMTDWLRTAPTRAEQRKIRSDVEGTSDKYARMISTWLIKAGFVKKRSSTIRTNEGPITGFQQYAINARGKHAIRQAHGSSKNSRVTKFVMWEFFATAIQNREYVRTRRSEILKALTETASIDVVIRRLRNAGFNDNEAVIRNDIEGLRGMGIRIDAEQSQVKLLDNIVDFSIPALDVTKELKNSVIEHRKAELLAQTNLPMKYIELVEIAQDGTRDREFEIITIELFKRVYGLQAVLMGGGRRPDGIVATKDFGIIVDTKAYRDGYSQKSSEEDKMVRYIVENQARTTERNPNAWWESFPDSIPDDRFYFMWISSRFIGQFKNQIQNTSIRTGTKGAALNVDQLLYGADAVMKGQLDVADIPKYIGNDEIIWIGD